MRRNRKTKRKLFITLVMLSILSIGLGYAILTETLTISNSVAISEMKWDVGFSSVADNGGSVLSDSSISSDGKTLTVMCDFGSHTDQETCTAKATIKNNSTFDVGLTQDPIITYDDTYIHTLTFKWNNHPTYENHTVLQDNFIAKGESEEVILTIKTKFMKIDMLPTSDMVIPITITLNFAEWRNGSLPTKNDLAVLKATSWSDTTMFRSSTYKEKIKIITFEDEINVPKTATASWDIGVSQNGNVMAYVTPNATDSTYYDLYIQSDTQLYANKDMSYWFQGLSDVESINGLELLDTSMTMKMPRIFDSLGKNSTIFTLDVSSFDTSEVIDMYGMFQSSGQYSTTFTLNLSSLDTSKATTMGYMFMGTGQNSTTLIIDLSNFDTSNVTSMNSMFDRAGQNSTTFTLDISNFDTSKVIDMAYMFMNTGQYSTTFTLDVSGFDTSNVTNMSTMFYYTGAYSTKLNTSITIRNPNVTYYSDMFRSVATKTGSQITVNYTSATSSLVDQMIATKSADSNVVKGVQVD